MAAWELVALLVLVVVLAFPAAILISVACGVLVGRQRQRCPNCGQRTLRCVQWIRATVLIDGKTAPDSWSYFLCESCGRRYKQHLGRDLEVASEEEWEQNGSEGT